MNAIAIGKLNPGRKFSYAHLPEHSHGTVVRQGIMGTSIDLKITEKVPVWNDEKNVQEMVEKVRYERNIVVSSTTLVLPRRRRNGK